MNDFERDRDGHARCGDDVAAYALGALTPEEAEVLEQHLSGCAVCRDELLALRQAAEALPHAAPQLAAPRSLKRRVMADVRSHPQGRGVAAGAMSRRRARPSLALGAGLALAAAIAAVVLALSGASTGPRTIQASVIAPGATAVLSENRGSGTLIVRHMPQPPRGKIYELWIERGGGAPTPTDALFGVTSSGAASVAVPGSLRGVRTVLVTPEPLGGSRIPTHAPVIVARV